MGEQPKVAATNWREHAQQARRQATAAIDLDTKQLLYAAADYYDNRARQAERPPAPDRAESMRRNPPSQGSDDEARRTLASNRVAS
jgi:hypothetical protein